MFLKNIFKIFSANIISQVISLAAVPLITRIYTPEDFGLFTSCYLAFVSLLAPAASLRFNLAIFIPKDEHEAAEVFYNAIALTFLTTSFLFIVLFTYYELNWFPKPWTKIQLNFAWWLIPIGVWIQGVQQVLYGWGLRHKLFWASAVSRVSESLSDRGIVIILGLQNKLGYLGLVSGRIFGTALSSLVLLFSIIKWNKPDMGTFQIKKIIRYTKKYRNFCIYSSPAALIDAGSRQLPYILLLYFFTPKVVGHYALAMQVVNIPTLIIGDAVASVFMQRAAEAKHKSINMTDEISYLMKYLFCISFPIIIILGFFGPELFEFVFGKNWKISGNYAQITVPLILITFLHRPLSSIFEVYERQRQRLVFDLILIIGKFAAIALGAFLSNEYIAIAGIVFWSSLLYLFGLNYLISVVKMDKLYIIKHFKDGLLSFLPFVLICFFSSYLNLSGALLIIVITISLIFQAILFLMTDKDLRRIIINYKSK